MVAPLEPSYDGPIDPTLEPFTPETGTYYPTSQEELDIHRRNRFKNRNKRPFVSIDQLTFDIISQNDERKAVSSEEAAAIDRLLDAVDDYDGGYQYGPDLAVKAFNDLDLVFFGGYLRGNVIVRWCAKGSDIPYLAWTVPGQRRVLEGGQCRIIMNASPIFEDPDLPSPFESMMSTLLHEMCHAIEMVRNSKSDYSKFDKETNGNGHHHHFQTRINVVHDRAMRLLGLRAIDHHETFVQHHWVESADGEEGYWLCGGHTDRINIGHKTTGGHCSLAALTKTGKHGGKSERGGRKRREHGRRDTRKGSDRKECIVM